MRLIDADDLLIKIETDAPGYLNQGSSLTKAFIMAMVNTKSVTPTIDAEPVVRCRGCRWGIETEDGKHFMCGNPVHGAEWHKANWYCADGVPKGAME